MATSKKIFYISTETSVSDEGSVEVPLGSSSGACGTLQVIPPVEPERQVALGVQVSPNNDDRVPLVNAENQAEGTSAEETTTANNTTCCDRYTDWAQEVVNSWMMLTVLLPLLGGCILFIYMGATYYHQCPFFPHFPLMTIIMGASGGLAILMRMLRILKPCRGHPDGQWLLRYLTNNGFLMFLVLFVLELGMYAFSDGYPTKDTGSDTYCDDIFYDFLKTSFAVVIVTMLLSGVIYGPLVHRCLQPLYPTEQAFVPNDI